MGFQCADPSICRGGCCRKFLDQQFCEMESNCVDHPTWIIILVPVLLGLAALAMIIIVLVRLNNRKTVDIYDHIKMIEQKSAKESHHQESQRKFISGNSK